MINKDQYRDVTIDPYYSEYADLRAEKRRKRLDRYIGVLASITFGLLMAFILFSGV